MSSTHLNASFHSFFFFTTHFKMAVKSPDNSDHLNLLRKRLRMIFSGVESAVGLTPKRLRLLSATSTTMSSPYVSPPLAQATLMQEELGLTSELNRQLGLQLRHYAAQIQQSLGALRLVEADAVEMASGKGPRPMHEDMRPLANIQPSSDAAHELRGAWMNAITKGRITFTISSYSQSFSSRHRSVRAAASSHDG